MSIELKATIKNYFAQGAKPGTIEFNNMLESLKHNSEITTPATGTNMANVLFVDPQGDDAAAAKGNFKKSYASPWGAKTAAVSGDTIIVMPGTYSITDADATANLMDTSLVKDRVNYFCYPGVIIESKATTTDLPLIYDDGGATCNIYGHAVLKQTGYSGVGAASYPRMIYINHASSEIFVQAKRIETLGKGIVTENFKSFSLQLEDELKCDYGTPLHFSSNAAASGTNKSFLSIDIPKITFDLLDADGLSWETILIELKFTVGTIRVGEIQTKANALTGAIMKLTGCNDSDLIIELEHAESNLNPSTVSMDVAIEDSIKSKIKLNASIKSNFATGAALSLKDNIDTSILVLGKLESLKGNAVDLFATTPATGVLLSKLEATLISHERPTITVKDNAIISGLVKCQWDNISGSGIELRSDVTLSLEGAKIITLNEASNSVYSDVVRSIHVLNVYANKAKHVNVTARIDTDLNAHSDIK